MKKMNSTDISIKDGVLFNRVKVVKVVSRIEKGKDKRRYVERFVECKCECGEIFNIRYCYLPKFKTVDCTETNIDSVNNNNISCSKCRNNTDLTNRTINNLFIEKRIIIPITNGRTVTTRISVKYNAICNLCNNYIKDLTELNIYKYKCGCQKNKKLLEKVTDTVIINDYVTKQVPFNVVISLHRRWYNIHKRCYDKKNKAYKYYGGRGIGVGDEWYKSKEGFLNFLEWSIVNGYKLTDNGRDFEIDRIDCDGNYEPSNCRYVKHKVNMNNRHKYGYLDIA